MSNTPETEKAEFVYNGIEASGYVEVEFAQKLERERDQWRECADRLVEAFRGVPYDPLTVGSFNAQNCKNALAAFRRLKEEAK